MKEKHFIITIDENLAVKKKIGTINRNSNSSQWIGVATDNWMPDENDVFFITLEHDDESSGLTTNIGPLSLNYNSALKRYVTLAPPELVGIAGLWQFSIEQRFDVVEKPDGEISYSSITSAIDFLEVVDSISKPTTGNIIKETELISAAKVIADNSNTALDAADRAAESAISAGMEADRAKENADLSRSAAEEAKEAAKIASSKAIVIWGFNEAVDISDLEWEVS